MKVISIFISSTCYDLVDARRELATSLEQDGLHVRMSDDTDSGFQVVPTTDSISACLENVDRSDAVICILDRRYGPVIPDRQYSATELEIRRAWEQNKPVFFFFRDRCIRDLEQLKRDANAKLSWVEVGEDAKAIARRDAFLRFYLEILKLTPGERSNWRDEFSTSVDLRKLVKRRLQQHFADYAEVLASHPDHVVRMHFIFQVSGASAINGCFQNAGVGPAFNIEHGWRRQNSARQWVRGALLEGDSITEQGSQRFTYQFADPSPQNQELPDTSWVTLYCEYSNRFGDRYRVDIPFFWVEDRRRFEPSGEDKFISLPSKPLFVPQSS